jgi:hypothetical protein
MRVSTVFTGAAAAAVAFTPAAAAGTGHAAGTGGKTLTVPRMGGRTTDVRPDHGRVSGSIRSSGKCEDAQWVHLEWDRGYTDCFGFKGLYSFLPTPLVHLSHECGGTNSGIVYTSVADSNFVPGTTYRGFSGNPDLSFIWIAGWRGTDKCGAFPAG